MYESLDFCNDLIHYGVKGMHWGIRRYQPYPKNYTGDGREVGVARKAQKSIEKDFRKSKTVHKVKMRLAKNKYVDEATNQNDFKKASEDVVNTRRTADNIYVTESTKLINKDLWKKDKNGKEHINMNHKVVKDFLNDIDAVDDPKAEKERLKDTKYAKNLDWGLYAESYFLSHSKEFPEYQKAIKNYQSARERRDALSKDISAKLSGDMGNVNMDSVMKKSYYKDVKEVLQIAINEIGENKAKMDISKKKPNKWSKSYRYNKTGPVYTGSGPVGGWWPM